MNLDDSWNKFNMIRVNVQGCVLGLATDTLSVDYVK